jgi:putative DNA-invertase from lambdoid prophage Rac
MKPPQEVRVAAYMRVSQSDLHLENQKPCLEDRFRMEGFKPENITWLTEEMSSGKVRPVKNAIMQSCREGQYDVVAFARIDRWGRSTVELISTIEELVKLGVRVIVPKNSFDLSKEEGGFNSTNRLIMTFFAAFAQFERELMQERTKDGVARARTWGKIVGRHPVGCGCGFRSEDGKKKHNGPIKPIRNDKNQIIGWKPPEGSEQAPEPPKEGSEPVQSVPITQKAVDPDFVSEEKKVE